MKQGRVLVTGGSGRLGRTVVDEIAAHAEVTVMDLVAPHRDLPFVAGDITDLDAVRRAVAGQQAIVHLAAIDLAIPATPERYFGVNVMGAWNVLQAAREAGIGQVVIIGSVAADGLTELRPDHLPQYLPIDENHPCRPLRPYGIGKRVIEEVAEAFTRHGDIRVVLLRPTVVAFPWYVPTLEKRLQTGERWLHAYVTPEDTAVACRLALDYTASPYAVMYLNSADIALRRPSLERAAELFGAVPPLRDPAWFEANPRAAFVDSRRAQRLLGWRPTSSWPDLVRRHGGG